MAYCQDCWPTKELINTCTIGHDWMTCGRHEYNLNCGECRANRGFDWKCSECWKCSE